MHAISFKTTVIIFAAFFSFSLEARAQPSEKELRKEATKNANEAKRYQKYGQAKRSAEFAVMALQGPLKRKKREKTLEIFKESFEKLVSEKSIRIDKLLSESKGYNGRSTVYSRKGLIREYQVLQSFMDTVQTLDKSILNEAGIDQRSIVSYEKELEKAKKNYDSAMVVYVKDSYQVGLEEVKKGNKLSYRSAFRLFDEIESLNPGYRHTDSLRNVAKENGTYKLTMGLMENRTGKVYEGNMEYVIAAQVSMDLQQLNISLLEILPLDASLKSISGSLSTAANAKQFAKQNEADIVLFGTFYDFQHSFGKPIVQKTEHSNDVPDGPEKWRVNSEGKKVKYQPMKTVYAVSESIKKGQQSQVKMSLFVYNSLTDEYISLEEPITGSASYSIEYNRKVSGDTDAIALYSKSWYPDVPPSLKSESEMLRMSLEDCIPAFVENCKQSLLKID